MCLGSGSLRSCPASLGACSPGGPWPSSLGRASSSDHGSPMWLDQEQPGNRLALWSPSLKGPLPAPGHTGSVLCTPSGGSACADHRRAPNLAGFLRFSFVLLESENLTLGIKGYVGASPSPLGGCSVPGREGPRAHRAAVCPGGLSVCPGGLGRPRKPCVPCRSGHPPFLPARKNPPALRLRGCNLLFCQPGPGEPKPALLNTSAPGPPGASPECQEPQGKVKGGRAGVPRGGHRGRCWAERPAPLGQVAGQRR